MIWQNAKKTKKERAKPLHNKKAKHPHTWPAGRRTHDPVLPVVTCGNVRSDKDCAYIIISPCSDSRNFGCLYPKEAIFIERLIIFL